MNLFIINVMASSANRTKATLQKTLSGVVIPFRATEGSFSGVLLMCSVKEKEHDAFMKQVKALNLSAYEMMWVEK